MSKVISFRLDEKNPREAQALTVLQQRLSEGYSIRQILVDALLSLSNFDKSSKNHSSIHEINQTLFQLRELLSQVVTNGQIAPTNEKEPNAQLSQTLLESIKKTLKPGLSISER